MSEKYRTNPFYNGVSSFKTAFPELADALIEWRERRGPDDERGGEMRKTGHRRGNLTQGVLPCSNPACREGGYQIDRLIAQMLELGETQRTGVMLCSGREIAEEARRGPIRCPYRIEYSATITRKTDNRPEPEPRAHHRRSRDRRGRRRSAA